MDDICFVWDDKTEAGNRKKHGVSFEEAKTAFYDDHARVIHDHDHSVDEERFVLLGMSVKVRLLVVCHYYRETDNKIRIISARSPTKWEQQQYRKFRK